MDISNKRTTDLQLLYAIRNELIDIEACDKQISDLEQQWNVEKENSLIHDIPAPIPKHHISVANQIIEERREKKKKTIQAVLLTINALAGLVIAILCCTMSIPEWLPLRSFFEITDWALTVFFIIIHFIILCILICATEIINDILTDSIFPFFKSIPIEKWIVFSTIIPIIPGLFILLLAIIFYLPLSLAGIPYLYCFGLGLITCILFSILKKIVFLTTKTDRALLEVAAQADSHAQEKYEQQVIDTLAQKKTSYEEKVKKLSSAHEKMLSKRMHHLTILSQLPGLSQQDKNKHAVTTMISYLERGKADSIKEALNLYDREERERADRNANNQILWQMQQQAQEDQRKALERMEEEQRRHNDAMRESERKRNEKIDDAIRDMKDSLRQ